MSITPYEACIPPCITMLGNIKLWLDKAGHPRSGGDMRRALDIARRWEQIAIFWWDGSKFWIQGAITDGHLELPIGDR